MNLKRENIFFVLIINIVTNYSLCNLTIVGLSPIIELDENNFAISTFTFEKKKL